MSQVLIIETDRVLGSRLASALRRQRFQVKKHKDVLEGLRELAWFSAQMIIWQPDPNDATKLKKFKAIKQYRRYTPLVILDDSTTFHDQLDENTFLYPSDTEPDVLVQKAVDLLGVPNTPEFEDIDNEPYEESGY
ncbi:MAG: hypothetical protein ONA69_07185 [candidate division KSB1 bacterium]|nr:hypothetical protein [candidate division KSB1 bacterium]MDZ7346563.1 hypothetical protein [candidate division KSB1 bacterium]